MLSWGARAAISGSVNSRPSLIAPDVARRLRSLHEEQVEQRDVGVVGRVELLVGRILVGHVLQSDAGRLHLLFVDVGAGGGPADVVIRTDRAQEREEPVRLGARNLE